MKYLLMLLMFGAVFAANLGCEAEGRIDDDNGDAKIEVDAD